MPVVNNDDVKPTASSILQIDNLHVEFDGKSAPRGNTSNDSIKAVRGVSLSLERGKTLGIVGESGSGKSVTALAIMRLLDNTARISQGKMVFDGVDLLNITEREMRDIRGSKIAMVFQDPLTSLNPTLTIGEQISETIRRHQQITARSAHNEAVEWLTRVHVSEPERRVNQYPFELSGGMRQRVMIAMAFSCMPSLLIADEPTTALDVTIQAQILDLMDELKRSTSASVMLISHDLAVIAERCDTVAVMYAGQIVEYGAADEVFENPLHPYTQALLDSLPDWRRPRMDTDLPAIPGQPPSIISLPNGCPFAPRCIKATQECLLDHPGYHQVTNGRYVRCIAVSKIING